MGDVENAQPCLFGWDPMPWKGARGRPPHLATEENVNRVKMLLAYGWTNKRIANALGITEPTLRKHYLSVLKVRDMARDALEAKLIERLLQQAERGNVGAIKRLEARLEDGDRARAINQAGRRRGVAEDADDDADVVAPAPRGKKESAVATAEAALARDPLLAGQTRLIN